MTGLLNVERIIVPIKCIEDVYLHLRECGLKRLEGVALWAGIHMDTVFEIKATLIPKQISSRTEDGLLYSVDGEELHRINVWLYRNKMTLVSQIHSHPGEAYHSETDDKYPIISVIGGISIVIPDFAVKPFKLKDWAVYRLAGKEQWEELNFREVESLITIVNNGISKFF